MAIPDSVLRDFVENGSQHEPALACALLESREALREAMNPWSLGPWATSGLSIAKVPPGMRMTDEMWNGVHVYVAFLRARHWACLPESAT